LIIFDKWSLLTSAATFILLAKIIQQKRAAAGRAFRVMNDLLQLRAGNFALLRIGHLIDEPAIFHAVAGTEQQEAFARQTIAARAARFLVIAFDVFRQIVVDDKPHVRFVDAHAERDRG